MKRALKFSLAANVLLLGAALLLAVAEVRPHPEVGPSRFFTQHGLRPPPQPAPVATNAPAAVVEINEDLRWSQLESEDYRAYIANLRGLGCPETTVRDLVVADVNNLFATRVKALVDGVTGRFWELTSRETDFEQLVEEKQRQLHDLREERAALFEALFGETNPLAAEEDLGIATARRANWERLTDFLPPEKRSQFADAKAALESQWEAFLNTPDVTDAQRNARRQELEAGLQATLRALLTPDELAELRLRESGAAGLRHRLAGLELNETETRLAAQIQFERDGASQARREPDVAAAEASLQGLLGPERWAAFQRSLDGRFDPFYRIAQRLELPASAAVEAFNLRCMAEAAAKGLRAGAGAADPEAQQTALAGIAAETRKSLTALLGAKGLAAYERGDGEWLREMAVVKQPLPPTTP